MRLSMSHGAAFAAFLAAAVLGCARTQDQCDLNPYSCPPAGAGNPGGAGGQAGSATDGGGGAGGGGCGKGQCPTCSDGEKNGGESGVDCGGPSCPACGGADCAQGADCVSGFCADGVCCDSPCDLNCEACAANITGALNGVCSPVPMGVPDGMVCALAGGCGAGDQCACEDGLRNLSETDQDCGGPDCPACAVGSACDAAADCVTENCHNAACCPALTPCGSCETCDASGACQPLVLASAGRCTGKQTCSADLDCRLQKGESCAAAADCASAFCKGNVNKKCDICQSDADCAASGDSSQCGGGWCKRPVGQACTTDLHCITSLCLAAVCAACAADAECASGECDVAAGSCRLHAGAPCVVDADCASGDCNGVCAE